MPTTTTYPNGQQLISSALTIAQAAALLQSLTCGMIGVTLPSIDARNFARVRVDWPTEGQPVADTPQDDVCFIQCVPNDAEYSRVRDRSLSGSKPGPLTYTWRYTRGWKFSWCAYGTNAEDNLRAVKSALFMDYFTDTLAASNLYPLPDPPEVTYLPEQLNAEWWARADFHVDLYEQVTETTTVGAVISVPIEIDMKEVTVDFTVTAS